MLGMNIMRNDYLVLIALLNQVFNALNAFCVRWHICVKAELVVRYFDAEKIEFAIRAQFGEFRQFAVVVNGTCM